MIVPHFTWWYLIVPDCTWWYLIVPDCTWLYLTVSDCTWLYLIVPDCTWLYLIVPDCLSGAIIWAPVLIKEESKKNSKIRQISGATYISDVVFTFSGSVLELHCCCWHAWVLLCSGEGESATRKTAEYTPERRLKIDDIEVVARRHDICQKNYATTVSEAKILCKKTCKSQHCFKMA